MKSTVGIIAPSSKVPESEFALGIDKIREHGFTPKVHPQCLSGHLFFAGTDEERARAFFDYAIDPAIPVLWCARGGYGAMRILPLLDAMALQRGIPEKKLLIGYSDATALLEYVRVRWGWSALHAPMPGLRKFCELGTGEWKSLEALIRQRKVKHPCGTGRLKFRGEAPRKAITGTLIGGNLSVWASLAGTPFALRARDRILFFEDVGENLYRLDRMIQQLAGSGSFEGAKAIVLGNFLDCRDTVPSVLKHAKPAPKGRKPQLVPLRRTLDEKKVIPELFAEVAHRLGIPVAYGLPVGHGPGRYPLPIGGKYRLTPQGALELLEWDHFRGT